MEIWRMIGAYEN